MKKQMFITDELVGIRQVHETVKVVEKIAASQIHTLKEQTRALTDYSEACRKALVDVSSFAAELTHPLLNHGEEGEDVLFVLTGEKGMVGGLFHDIITEALKRKRSYARIYLWGAKGLDYAREESMKVEPWAREMSDRPTDEDLHAASHDLVALFLSGQARSVDILYPRFESLAVQRPKLMTLLPFAFAPATAEETATLPVFEPSKSIVFEQLMSAYVRSIVAKVLVETKLSEQAARTVTAEHASTQTGGMMRKLRLSFLKERRRSTTQSQLESVAAHRLV